MVDVSLMWRKSGLPFIPSIFSTVNHWTSCPHDVTTQKTNVNILTIMITSNLTVNYYY
jgi:hypothetical protein